VTLQIVELLVAAINLFCHDGANLDQSVHVSTRQNRTVCSDRRTAAMAVCTTSYFAGADLNHCWKNAGLWLWSELSKPAPMGFVTMLEASVLQLFYLPELLRGKP
jgi:hypothetical protein